MQKETQQIAEEKVSYQANAETFNKGMTYEGMVHLENPSGHVMGNGYITAVVLHGHKATVGFYKRIYDQF